MLCWLCGVFPAPNTPQRRAGEEQPELRLPRDVCHSLQRCSDLLTPDTNSGEMELNLATG